MMFEELYHHMGSRQMSHDNFLVKVKLQVPFETPGMELVLHVVHHPVVDSHEPLGLVVVGWVLNGPGLNYDHTMTGQTKQKYLPKGG